MSDVLSLRSDAEVEAALVEIGTEYGSRSSTLKAAILNLADQKRRARLREESLAAANDPADLAEARTVLSEMEQLRAR